MLSSMGVTAFETPATFDLTSTKVVDSMLLHFSINTPLYMTKLFRDYLFFAAVTTKKVIMQLRCKEDVFIALLTISCCKNSLKIL